MTTLFKVSQSKVRDWRQCHQKWWYKHVLKIQRKRRPRPFAFGGIVHQMKQAMAGGKDPFKAVLDKLSLQTIRMFREEREYYGDIVQDIRYLFEAYLQYYANPRHPDPKRRPLVFLKRGKSRAEHPFELKFPREDLLVKGTIDAATRFRSMDWLTEHKNNKTIPNDDERWKSVQSVVYIRISEMLGWWSFEGTCWDYIRTKPPTRPQLLKDGDKLSARSLDSLPQVVIDVIKENKLKVSDYAEMIDAQDRNMSSWFQRVYTPLKKKVLDNLWNDFLITSREMRDTNTEKQQPRSIGRHCDWCEFNDLCRTALQGGDEDFIREHHYEESTYDNEKEVGED